MKRIMIYCTFVETGKTNYVAEYDNWKDAIYRITSLYLMDEKSAMKGCYYYSAKER